MFRCFDCRFCATVSSPYHPNHKFSEHQEGHMFSIGQVRCDHQQTFTFDWHPGWGKSWGKSLPFLQRLRRKSNLPKTGRDMDMREDRISYLSRSRVMGDTPLLTTRSRRKPEEQVKAMEEAQSPKAEK